MRSQDHRTGIVAALLVFAASVGTAGGQGSVNVPPAAPPPSAVSLPQPLLETLPNGLRVLLIERRSDPLVTLHAMVMAGSSEDPPGRAGTAQFVAGLLTQGTARQSALQLAQTIDAAGGSMQAGAGWDETMASVSVLADRQALAFRLLSDMLIHPAFAPSEMQRYRRQTISALRVLKEDPHYVAHTLVREALLAGTPYAHPPEGTEATLDAITREDLERFHAKYFRPANTALAVLGDVTPEECKALAEKYFGGWVGREMTAVKMPSNRQAKPRHEVILINQPGAAETEIRVGFPGIPRSSPQYPILKVANEALGGPAGNRLFFELRTRRGLAYSASSRLRCYRWLGAWIAKTSTRSSEAARAVTEMMAQIQRLRSRPVSRPELHMAQNYLVGHLALQFEPLNGIAAHSLELILYNMPLDYWSTYASQIRSVRQREVRRAAARLLRPKDDVIVLVGNVAGDVQAMRRFGPVRMISLRRLDLGARDFESGRETRAAGRRHRR